MNYTNNVHNKDRYFKNTESESLKTANLVFSLWCLNPDQGQCFRSRSCNFSKNRTLSFWNSTCDRCPCPQLWNWGKRLFFNDSQRGGDPRPLFSKQRVHAGPPKHRHDIVVSAQRCLQMGVFRGFQYQSGNVGKELWTCCRPCSRMGVWSCTYAGYQEEEPAAYSMSACACDWACASEHCCHPTAAEGVCQQRQRSLLSLFTSVWERRNVQTMDYLQNSTLVAPPRLHANTVVAGEKKKEKKK